MLAFVTNYGRFLVSSQTSDSQFVNLIYYAYSELIRKISDKNFSVRRLYHQQKIQTETDVSSVNYFRNYSTELIFREFDSVFNALLNW